MGMLSNSPRQIFNDWDDNGLPTGSRHIGKTGKTLAVVSASFLVDDGTDYADLDLAATPAAVTLLSNCARVAGGGGVIRQAILHDRGDQGPSVSIMILSGSPGNSTLTDNGAFVLVDQDIDLIQGIITAGSPHTFATTGEWHDLNTSMVAFEKDANIHFDCAPGTRNLWCLVQLRSPWNAGGASDLGVSLMIEQF